MRNQQETDRLNSFLVNDLPKIKMEEDLLLGFNDTNKNLSCIGFTQLYQEYEDILSNAQYIQFQLYCLKNRWAFWLKSIIDKFNQFKETVYRDIKANNFKKLIIEPNELIKLGKYYRDIEDWSKALLCYQEARKDQFYSYSNYYAATCEQNINFTAGISSKRKFKHNLINVKKSIEKEYQFLNNATQVALEIGEKNRKLGSANFGNEYDKQAKEKLAIWSIFLQTITNALSSDISLKNLTATKYLCDEKDAELYSQDLKLKNSLNQCELPKRK